MAGNAEMKAYFSILRANWWKILFLSLAAGVVTLLLLFFIPNEYRSSAVIFPAPEEQGLNPAFGALATFGISVGAPSKVEDLEALFKSDDLTVRVFRKYELWPVVFARRYDPRTGTIRAGWMDRLFRGKKEGPPGDWDAIRLAEDHLRVSVNKRIGNLTVSFESFSPEGSAKIVKHYLEEAKSRLQEEALERAGKNKKFILEQIEKTVDALTRERLYSLYGQEVEREMMARNREQFGFTVLDSPKVPDRKSRPSRAKLSAAAAVLTFLGAYWYFVLFGKREGSVLPGD